MSRGEDVNERAQPLVGQLRRITQLIVEELVGRLQAAGFSDITAAHHPVFYNLDPDGTRLTVLAARAGMTHQSMGELVAALADLGYLDRRPDPADRRARLVVLTPLGTRAVERARSEVADIDAAWIRRLRRAGLSGDIRQALTAALDQAATR
jgi:DNA-binding MarR family transcriptional regulator